MLSPSALANLFTTLYPRTVTKAFRGDGFDFIQRRECSMTITERIEMNPKIMMGKPVIRGTRIAVELIVRKISEGATEADLIDAYPKLTHEDIQAAIRYAADTLAHEEIVFIR